MGKFISNKTVIYLDQFAVSNLSEEDSWKEFLNLLNEGIRKEKLAVLYSTEHLIESCQKDYERAVNADRLLFTLSKGLSLETEAITTSRLLINVIRKIPSKASTYCLQIKKPVLEDKEKYENLRELKSTFNQMVGEGTSLVNQIRDATRVSKKGSIEFQKQSALATSVRYQKELEKRLKKFSRYGFYDRHPVTFSMHTIPFWADSIMDILINHHHLNRKEAKKGEDILNKQGLKKILPPLYVRTVLETMLAVKHQKETANDHLDIVRLCCAVPFADIVLTDKSKVYDIKSIGLDSDFNTEIFSGIKADLENFKKRLEQIMAPSISS